MNLTSILQLHEKLIKFIEKIRQIVSLQIFNICKQFHEKSMKFIQFLISLATKFTKLHHLINDHNMLLNQYGLPKELRFYNNLSLETFQIPNFANEFSFKYFLT